MLETFADFRELKSFLIEIAEIKEDETTYDYYIHKSTFSDISYTEFKENMATNIQAKAMTNEDVVNIFDELSEFVNFK